MARKRGSIKGSKRNLFCFFVALRLSNLVQDGENTCRAMPAIACSCLAALIRSHRLVRWATLRFRSTPSSFPPIAGHGDLCPLHHVRASGIDKRNHPWQFTITWNAALPAVTHQTNYYFAGMSTVCTGNSVPLPTLLLCRSSEAGEPCIPSCSLTAPCD